MACKPCEEKQKKEVQAEEEGMRHSTYCLCGLMRMLPAGIKVGDEFTLVPCPRCGQPYVGKFLGDKVERFN